MVDGLWIGTMASRPKGVLHRVEEALALIQKYDPRRYACLRRDLSRIWVRVLTGERASFNRAAQACQLEERFVRDEAVSTAEIATAIIHEAAHARIERYGIVYETTLRGRIESRCMKEEIAFAHRLPDGAAIAEAAQKWVTTPPSDAHWADSAFSEREWKGGTEALEYLGAPKWLIPVLLWPRKPISLVRRVLGTLRAV